MSLRNLEYALGESLVGIRRNGLMSFASISTMGLSLGILGGIVLLALGLNNGAKTLLDKFEIAVFLEEDVPVPEVAELGARIEALPHVKSVRLIPAEEGWRKLKRSLGRRVDLSGVEKNPLPDSFRVKADHPRHTVGMARALRKMTHVDEVVEAREIVELMVRMANFVRIIGALSAGVFFIAMAFIVSNTIRLTVYARRREIKIMQLVGATNWFIRLPFFFEGMILGTIGGGIACGLVLGGSHYIARAVVKVMPLVAQFSSEVDPRQFFGGLVLLGCLMGAMGSLVSVRRFLKA